MSGLNTLKTGDGSLVRLSQLNPLNQPLFVSSRFGEGDNELALADEQYLSIDLFTQLRAGGELRHIGYSDYRICGSSPVDGNNQCHVFTPEAEVQKALASSDTLSENGTQISGLCHEDTDLNTGKNGFIFRFQGYATLLCSIAFTVLDYRRFREVDYLAQSAGFQNALLGFKVPEIRKPLKISELLSSQKLHDSLNRFFKDS